jgi:hypothetical protein
MAPSTSISTARTNLRIRNLLLGHDHASCFAADRTGGSTGTPLLKMLFSPGIVNNNGPLYSVFSTGLASLNGVYRAQLR